jgi:hypothetical protein
MEGVLLLTKQPERTERYVQRESIDERRYREEGIRTYLLRYEESARAMRDR